MRSVIAIVVIAIAVGFAKEFVFGTIILGPHDVDFVSFRAWCYMSHILGLGDKLCVSQIEYVLINTNMPGQFLAHILVSVIGGVIISFPYIFYEFWSFIKPGLKKTEVVAVKGITFFTSLLFFFGIVFGYFVIVPLSLQFLGGYHVVEGLVENTITLMSYMKLVMSIVLAAGLIFQLPMVIYFLSKIGLVTPKFLKKYRKHALVIVLVLSALITPPDLTSQILVSLPVLLLYEISIVISKRVNKKFQKSE
jgi:sec-independent protein translocase protein TatC